MLDYIWLIPILPLAGFVINGFLGKRLPPWLVGLIAFGAVGLSFLVSLLSLVDLLGLPEDGRIYDQFLFAWIPLGDFQVDIAFRLDPLSAVMILVVSGVGFLIHLYSVGYMKGDPNYSRYFAYLNLFVFFMLILVLANNFLLMFVGWEGVGLCSYLLIGFWFERKAAADAGMKAFVVNRIGDFGFILAIILIAITFGTVGFGEVFDAAHDKLALGGGLATAITLLLFLGAVGKSAQIPLYIWLPDAMEGPTPVSALIHAATMVTAGVYMVARSHVLYELAPISLNLVAIIGAVTALFAASIALVQNDIKRVLAYSTISQLGYMFLGAGVGAFSAGVFHLMTHAFFKALLFLAAGSVMHAMGGETDIRKMGGLKKHIPTTYWVFIIGILALSGIPLLSGFFSKDEILGLAYASGPLGRALWAVGIVVALLTALYAFRLVFVTFLGSSRVPQDKAGHLHESPPVMIIPLVVLAVLSVIGGYIGLPKLMGGNNRFEAFLEPVFGHHEIVGVGASTVAQGLLVAAAAAVALIGLGLAYRLYLEVPEATIWISRRAGVLYRTLVNKYYVDEFYHGLFVRPLVAIADEWYKTIDVAVVDGIVNGIAKIVRWGSRIIRRVNTGYVRSYAFYIFLGAVIIIAYYIFRR